MTPESQTIRQHLLAAEQRRREDAEAVVGGVAVGLLALTLLALALVVL